VSVPITIRMVFRTTGSPQPSAKCAGPVCCQRGRWLLLRQMNVCWWWGSRLPGLLFCSDGRGNEQRGCTWRSIDVDLKMTQDLDNSPRERAGEISVRNCFYQNSASVRSYQNSIQLAVCLERIWPLLAEELRPQVQDVDKVAFPAVLGWTAI